MHKIKWVYLSTDDPISLLKMAINIRNKKLCSWKLAFHNIMESNSIYIMK